MYQAKEIPLEHPAHSKNTEFTEVQVWEGIPATTLLQTFEGPKARIEARNFIKNLGWSKPKVLEEIAC